ncbi:MAG TPA: DUF4982 domain-containing protein [Phnomibacter sp.]|nr:DUF4982 domain-containing protein [Phnomibacter sp.]
MNKIRLAFLLIVSISLNKLYAQTEFPRTKYNFNTDWKVFVGDTATASAPTFSDGDWKKVTLPYAWNEDDAFRKDIVDHTTGIAWYRKHFKLPSAAKGQKVFLEFEGIRQGGDFYLNGQHIGISENGITSFGFDVSDLVKFGDDENLIAARIDNSWEVREKSTNARFQWEDKNFNANYGGIQKNVFLHIVPKVYQTLPLYSNLKTTGVYIYADNFNIKGKSATIHAESEVKNETEKGQQVSYEVVLTDLNGKAIKTFGGEVITIAPGETKILKAESFVNGLNFWSWGYGYLYDVKTILKIGGKQVDAVNTKTGFRNTAFKNGMIYLNDRVIMVHGYAQRTSNEWPGAGMSVPAWLSDYSNNLMVESGANLVRWMHITPWKQDVESCDRVGLMQAMPAGDAEKDVKGNQWNQRKNVMRDAIIYNRNNPSIIFYESGNNGISEAHMNDMKQIRDQYDPHGGRAIGSRNMMDSKTAEYGGEMLYTNKSAGKPMWAMEYSRDEGSRKYWDDFTPPYHKDGDGPLHRGQPAKDYNRNMESHAVENVARWYEFWNERPGTGKRVSSGGVNIVWSETNTHHRGEENYRRSGEVDAMRIKKQNFYAHQVMWDGWVSPERNRLHIIGHWNYAPGVKKDIYVVASAEKVELKVNGQSLGFGEKSSGFLFRFKNVVWKAGSISAIGYDVKGKQVCGDTITTVGEPVALRMTQVERPTPFLANGQDLVLVEVEVVDARGNRCPTALNMISYSMDGPAEWRGGMAMGPDNHTLTKMFPVENGVNRFLIRSTTTPGTISVKANAEGLKPASLSITSHPFITENGLAKMLPSDGLSSRLERGPTPSTPSFIISRKPLAIKAATAGSAADSIFYTYDDNEVTKWTNDGQLNTAWVEYELENEAILSEVTLKLTNFKSKTFPLTITVDGKTAFKGVTEPTLGYYTIKCTTPVKGKRVRIEMTAPSGAKEKNIGLEVTGKVLDDDSEKKNENRKGSLGIIEIELYQGI